MCSAKEEKLFAKTVPVFITDAFSTYLRSLFLSIEWQQISAMILKKELIIRLTDDNDPFFLYNLHLSEDDYLRLKSSQNLIMDFYAFPQRVIKAVEDCLKDANKQQPENRLHLMIGETVGNFAATAQLDIEKSSAFKQISQVSLKFLTATDSAVKQHMTACFTTLKEEKQRLENQLHCLEKDFHEKFSSCESALKKKCQELETVRKELSAEISQRESKYTHALMEERETLLNKQREGENRLESERIDREIKLKNEISQLEVKVSCLETINKELENKKDILEKNLNELRSQSLSAENDLRLKSEALMIADKKNSEFYASLKEQNERINHLMGNINRQNEDLRQKQTQVHSMQKELEIHKKEKKKLDKSLEAAKEKLKEEEKLRTDAEKDLFKANRIIEKLQNSARYDEDEKQVLKEKNGQLGDELKEKKQVIQNFKRGLEKEKEINLRFSIEIQQIPVHLERICKLEDENKRLSFENSALSKELRDRGFTIQYVPLPDFEEKFPPVSEAVNVQASGDTDLHKRENSVPPTSGVRPKSIPSRLSSPLLENGLQPEARQIRTSLPGNGSYSPVYNGNGLQPEIRQISASVIGASANSTSQAFNAKASTIIASDKNANLSKLEINANRLSSEFQDLNLSKHSTARKQTRLKSSSLPVKT